MKLIWLDIETTGLDPRQDVILEIAAFEADISKPFEVLPLYERVLSFPPATAAMAKVDPFVKEMHTKNGLWDACAASRLGSATVDKELETILIMLQSETDPDNKPVLAGSSIHFDHSFLSVHLPYTAARLSHRHYDVSAVKMFAQSLGMPKFPKGDAAHRAKDDVLVAIAHAKACAMWFETYIG